ncbi:MAG: CHASE2 domain-containing sensor protein/tRNA A-37 threonylcarbamoyl transferase component Bud32 [Planctomycetota bacterium]|jgi:CHASE2 domain-containing sensor protein/tRNA A-37 threonylcarbamoyl transferase component Bud32
MKTRFWSSDWFAGLLITIAVVLFSGSASFQSLERSAYDWGVRSTDRLPSEKIAIIAIDDESIANIGRWPWPRDLHAELIDRLSEGGAKVVGQTVFFLEPQIDPGTLYIRDLIEFFSKASFDDVAVDIDALSAMLEFSSKNAAVAEILEFYRQSSVNSRLSQDIETLKERLFDAEQSLNTDLKLAQSMAKAKNVVLAAIFTLGQPRGKPDHELPGYVLKNSLSQIRDRVSAQSQGLFPIPTINALPPIAEIGPYALAIGHLNGVQDIDGGVRSEPLVLQHYDRFYPSISLQIAAKSLNLGVEDINVNLAESVELGSLVIKTDTQLQMNTFYYSDIDGFPAFQVDSFYDVFTGKIPIEKYKNKIVLIGPTAIGVGSPQVTPIDSAMAPVITLAHSVSSILQEDFFIMPEWALWARLGAFLLIMLYLMLAMPRMKAGVAAVVTLLLLLTLIASHYILMTGNAMWIQLMTPAALLVLGHLLITTKRFLVTERGKARSDVESAESNRMLGIAFQSQGQLDMAFEKFRKCSPVDDQVMEAMYNLALDFERKRQFNKANSVYQYMSKNDKKFRDIESRMNRAQKMEETVMLGGSGGHAGGTLMLDGGDIEKPMLGRYEVEKELGKGAMGIVYLGKDPKISRVVAIKTMALAQEFEEDELQEVKERFFREAETAGRLSHPHIVTIFDAGEEHDLAYIAMEFLKGHDLARYCKPDNLLEMKQVVSIVLRSADGLDFAHQQNVVHRDIKPANIMYDPESDSVKITDFGIARITDSSKTKTGMVLGTPSYMSPEQLAGKKVDGRSDLFSLGVMLYQMVSGSLPFKADSMASLMFKITNDEAEDVRTIRADIPEALAQIINKALAKDADARYQTGKEFAKALKAFLDG